MERTINNDITNIGNPQENLQMKSKTATQIVKEGIKQAHPHLNETQIETASKQLLSNNNNGKVKVGDTEISIGDFAYSVALSIQAINSETSPQEEFYRWIDDAKLVISEMTDNCISDIDLKHREEFIANMDQREIEIKTCISLYESAVLYGSSQIREQAQKQLEFLRMKWAKLMELRSAVKNSTKSRLQVMLEPKVTEEEHVRGKLYLMTLQYMKKGLDVPTRIKLKLGLTSAINFEHGIADVLVNKIRPDTTSKEDVITRINILRGRQEPSYGTQSNQNRMYFSTEKFYSLMEKYNSNVNF